MADRTRFCLTTFSSVANILQGPISASQMEAYTFFPTKWISQFTKDGLPSHEVKFCHIESAFGYFATCHASANELARSNALSGSSGQRRTTSSINGCKLDQPSKSATPISNSSSLHLVAISSGCSAACLRILSMRDSIALFETSEASSCFSQSGPCYCCHVSELTQFGRRIVSEVGNYRV